MTADIELLPSSVAAFTEALKGDRGSLDAWLEVNDEREVAAHVEAYTRANVAHATAAKDAEIEALRALLIEACDDGDEADADLLATLERARTAEANVKALRAEVRDLRRRQAGWGRHIAADGCEYVREGEHDALVNRRAERLAEALREIERLMPDQAGPAWIAKTIASAALRDHDKEGT